jgi:acyl-CoA reductase-like NAD-dependent aldehyde dehydrogenase
VEPTVLRTTSDSKVWHTEIFGPVLSVVTFKDEAEAIRLANDTEVSGRHPMSLFCFVIFYFVDCMSQ